MCSECGMSGSNCRFARPDPTRDRLYEARKARDEAIERRRAAGLPTVPPMEYGWRDGPADPPSNARDGWPY